MIQRIQKWKKQDGFTLVEIIVVLVILAILAAFTIPAMLGFVDDARGKALVAQAREIYVAGQAVGTEFASTGRATSVDGTTLTSESTGGEGTPEKQINNYVAGDIDDADKWSVEYDSTTPGVVKEVKYSNGTYLVTVNKGNATGGGAVVEKGNLDSTTP